MAASQNLRWGGWVIILSALLTNSSKILAALGFQNTANQAIYGLGFTGLVLSITIIHITQAPKAGGLGLVAYLISVLSLTYANVANFLILAELAGVPEARQAMAGIWNPVLQISFYGVFSGLALLGISVARAGILSRWGGIILTAGAATQLLAQAIPNSARPLYLLSTIGGTVLNSIGLIEIGWVIRSEKEGAGAVVKLSNLDRAWGGPFVMLSAGLLVLNAYLNSFADLILFDGITNLLSTTAFMFTIVILYTAQAERSERIGLAGFVLTHLGATLSVITAYLIMAQLAGQIQDNRALMASWVDIPVGRVGSYMLLAGLCLFGVGVVRAAVFPSWSGWLFLTGFALFLPSQFQSQAYLFSIFWVIGAVLQGISLGWMGLTLILPRKATG